MPSSPTNAAHTLASIAQHQVLSAESICPWPVLLHLIDDYFTFIHPLVPLPHEPSFRIALQQRHDLNNPLFLASIASMVGCLAASFPRRPREHLRAHNFENLFPSSMSLVERCHKVAIESQPPMTFNREYTVHDAIISYLQGLTSESTGNRPASLLYFKQCLSIVTSLGLHKGDDVGALSNGAPPPRMTPNGHSLQGPQQRGSDLVTRELGRRLFWSLFVVVRAVQQLGVSSRELNIPPATKSEPYPPLPMEVDDTYLTPSGKLSQAESSISEIVGFNANVRVFQTQDVLSTNEFVYGVNEIFDWERQRADLERSLDGVKMALEALPSTFTLGQHVTSTNTVDHEYPSISAGSLQALQAASQADNIFATSGRLQMQQALQKLHLHANQIGTRSYLIQKFSSLSSALQRSTSTSDSSSVPIVPLSRNITLSSNPLNETTVKNEGHAMLCDAHLLLRTTTQISLEMGGAYHVHKIRHLILTLLATHAPSGNNSANSRVANAIEYLRQLIGVLMLLEAVLAPKDAPNVEEEEAQAKAWEDFHRVQGIVSR